MASLIEISSGNASERVADIVFIHGLNDHAATCWKPKELEGKDGWPEWMSKQFPSAGVWLTDYENPLFNWQGTAQNLPDRARSILDLMETEPNMNAGSRPLMLIGHSMGGLVIKQMLCSSLTLKEERFTRIGKQVKAVVFLSTPHLGAQLVTFLQNMDRMGLLRNSDAMKSMTDNDPHLRELNDWYRDNVVELGIKTRIYLENKPMSFTKKWSVTPISVIIVDRKTGDMGLPGVGPIVMDDDHLSICKPNAQNAQVVNSVNKFLKEVIAQLTEPKTPAVSEKQWNTSKANVIGPPVFDQDETENEAKNETRVEEAAAKESQTPEETAPDPMSPLLREPPGGVMRPKSSYYVERGADAELRNALKRKDNLILVRGARQVGKSSLFVRGMNQARDQGAKVVRIAVEEMSQEAMESEQGFLQELVYAISDSMNFDKLNYDVRADKGGVAVATRKFFTRYVLGLDGQVVLALDELEKLFGKPWSNRIFTMLRNWHENSAMEPEPWSRLTLLISYSTEPSLFITEMDQSPFNVGTPLSLHDFSFEQASDLNRRYKNVLRSESELRRLVEIVAGHPYLLQLGMDALAFGGKRLKDIENAAANDEGIFSSHLRHIHDLVRDQDDLLDVVRRLLEGKRISDPMSFYRLRRAGLVDGGSCLDMRMRCKLYEDYFRRNLA